ncbi:Nuclease-related domain-containing protein [Gracilibacillus orientalis]|uniref:Nuclease-related domain-containing protein n=1 Tax=Gracilibacillus orientalis TaxID=334253 RepID=A0A1I4PKK3_9BACI|nr:nuclease-related domain-containing protein [Gracilibacillus orientalis]SFM28332.1 Nuclease-related domain-containing protein [Gracilibacillus orientalis]
MIEKALEKPHELVMYEALFARTPFSMKEDRYFYNLKMGYEGEKKFEQFLDKTVDNRFIVLSDLRLEVQTTTFQIDSIVLTGDTLYFFDVKNYSGDYKYAEKRWYKLPDKEVSNPLLQLMRNETLMSQVLQQLHVSLPVECFDVFINPEFNLYQAPLNKHIIFPTQLPKSIKELASKIPVTSSQHTLAQQLISRDIGDYPHPRIPAYNFQQLKKGLRCSKCSGLSVFIEGRKALCPHCQQVEPIHKALLRNIKELHMLFPDEKLTTNFVYDWCGDGYSKKSIQRLLDDHFQKKGVRQWTYYE